MSAARALAGTVRSSATVLDPVCRMEIRPEEAVADAWLEGRRRFYFCSWSCYEAFLDLPHTYVGWTGREVQPPPARRRGSAPFGERPG